MAITPAGRGRNPYDRTGIVRGSDGIARYHDRPVSLVHMLRDGLDRNPDGIAVTEVGGESVSYAQLWDRAARVAGGLRDRGLQSSDRAAIVLPNGLDWVTAFWGVQLAGMVAVPVNTRFTESEIAYVVSDSQAGHVFRPGGGLPDGPPVVVDDLTPSDLAAIFYTTTTRGSRHP